MALDYNKTMSFPTPYFPHTFAPKQAKICGIIYLLPKHTKSISSISDVEIIPLLSLDCPWHDLQYDIHFGISSRFSEGNL